MKWVLIVIVALAVIVAVVAFVGSRLPVAHVASQSATLAAPPDAIWKAITDIDAFPSWRKGVKSVERLPDRAGKTAWAEHTSNGRIPLVVERSEPPRLLVLRIADPDLPFGGNWTYELTPAPGGTTLTITENGEVYNPIFRFMARFIFGYDGTMKEYLQSLEARRGV
jgi:Polyketide cyclase / dehydrase and lipid transport